MGIPAETGVTASGQPNSGDQANAVISGTISGVGPTAPFAFRGPMNLAVYASINTSLATTAGSLSATLGSATGIAIGDAINSVNVPHGSTIGTLSSTTVGLALSPHTDWGVFGPTGLLTGAFSTSRILGATITIPSNAEGVTLPANTVVSAIVQANVKATDTSPGVPGIVQLSAVPTLLPTDPNPRAFTQQFTANGVTVTGTDTAAIFTGAGITWNGTLQLERSFDGGLTWIVCNIGGAGALALWTGATVTPLSLTFGEPEKYVLYRLNQTAYSSGTITYRISQTGAAAESLAIGPLSGG